MDSLTDILSGGTPAPETAAPTPPEQATDVKPAAPASPEVAAPASSAGQAQPETPTEIPGERVRDEKGRFVKPEEVNALRTAMQEERRRRQEAERKLAETAQQPAKTLWDDPEGFVDERVSKVSEKADARFYSLSERLAKQQHADFDDVVNGLLADCEADPTLGTLVFQQLQASDHPADALYRYAANRRELKTFDGDIGKYRESVTAPLKTENATLKAEVKRLQEQLETLSKVPSSLTAEPSASNAQVALEATGTETLTDILKPRTKRRA